MSSPSERRDPPPGMVTAPRPEPLANESVTASVTETATESSAAGEHAIQLPIFVYGTLRRGQENYGLLRGRTLAETAAVLYGVELVSLGWYPAALESDSPSAAVHGEVVIIHPHFYSTVLETLDRLEGYHPGFDALSFYRRVQRSVHTATGRDVQAWLYLGRADFLHQRPHESIPAGDWVQFRRDRIRSAKG